MKLATTKRNSDGVRCSRLVALTGTYQYRERQPKKGGNEREKYPDNERVHQKRSVLYCARTQPNPTYRNQPPPQNGAQICNSVASRPSALSSRPSLVVIQSPDREIQNKQNDPPHHGTGYDNQPPECRRHKSPSQHPLTQSSSLRPQPSQVAPSNDPSWKRSDRFLSKTRVHRPSSINTRIPIPVRSLQMYSTISTVPH